MLWFQRERLDFVDKIDDLNKKLEEANTKCEMYKKRCVDIEDRVQEDFQVKIRQEITEITIDFNLMELTIMHLAICRLMERPMLTEDLQYYMTLRVKLEDLMTKVKE